MALEKLIFPVLGRMPSAIQNIWLRNFNFLNWKWTCYKHIVLYKELHELNRKFKFIFIHIPKCAGFAIRKKLGIDNVKFMHAGARYYKKALGENYTNYFTFAFVRHPIKRLIASYSYMKQGGVPGQGGPYFKYFTKNVINKFNTFEDFVAWLSNGYFYSHEFFFPQYLYVTDFDDKTIIVEFIGKVEKIPQDFPRVIEILKQRGMPISDPHLPRINTSNQKWKPDKLSSKTIQQLYEIYKKDFDLFDYDPENWR